MRAKDQCKNLDSRLELVKHQLFNQIAGAIQAKIKEDTGIEVDLIGKNEVGGEIKATLVGQTGDSEAVDKADRTMQQLRNPANFTNLVR